MKQINLILIHIGKSLPFYIFDTIFQCMITLHKTTLHILVASDLIEKVNNQISNFTDIYPCHIEIKIHPLGELDNNFNHILKRLPQDTINFRDGFNISTITRFYYISEYMKLFKLDNVFHMENDIMLYHDLQNLEVTEYDMYVCRDNNNRVIPSVVFMKDYNVIEQLWNFMLETLLQNHFLNDMQLLSMFAYAKKELCGYFNVFFNPQKVFIVDAAAIGQYLGGYDPRNLNGYFSMNKNDQLSLEFNNPSVGSVNPDVCYKITKQTLPTEYLDSNRRKWKIKHSFIFNLHIHCKQLFYFSSVMNIKCEDIITGDKIVSLCDFVLIDKQVFDYHKNILHFTNYSNLCFANYLPTHTSRIIKIFIYMHLLDNFISTLSSLDISKQYILYLHNSDHPLTDDIVDLLLKNKQIIKIYSQNPNCKLDKKIQLLPIGLQNSMFYSNINENCINLIQVIRETYFRKKDNLLYVNINPKTFPYRKNILTSIQDAFPQKPIMDNKSFLYDLSNNMFCLCVRGNGVDTHRFWESLYLGVIPVIINNKYTNIYNFVNYLRKSNIPFVEIVDDDVTVKSFDVLDKLLYKNIVHKYGPIQMLPCLKLAHYDMKEEICPIL